MASPDDLPQPDSGDHAETASVLYEEEPPIARVRVSLLDVLCTAGLWTTLFVLATQTSWPTRLFGFLNDVCPPGACAPVPYGLDIWIYPVVWGGIGAAISAAVIGPCVSVLKGWYMSFWLVIAMAIMLVSSVVGSAMTTYSATYWH